MSDNNSEKDDKIEIPKARLKMKKNKWQVDEYDHYFQVYTNIIAMMKDQGYSIPEKAQTMIWEDYEQDYERCKKVFSRHIKKIAKKKNIGHLSAMNGTFIHENQVQEVSYEKSVKSEEKKKSKKEDNKGDEKYEVISKPARVEKMVFFMSKIGKKAAVTSSIGTLMEIIDKKYNWEERFPKEDTKKSKESDEDDSEEEEEEEEEQINLTVLKEIVLIFPVKISPPSVKVVTDFINLVNVNHGIEFQRFSMDFFYINPTVVNVNSKFYPLSPEEKKAFFKNTGLTESQIPQFSDDPIVKWFNWKKEIVYIVRSVSGNLICADASYRIVSNVILNRNK